MTQNHEFKKSTALVGIGRWGKNLARNFHSLGALHTICDTRETTHDVYQSMYSDVAMTTNFKGILENPEITNIAIAAPAAQHYALTKKALEAGKDVYVEKPLCLDSTEGDELNQLAEEKGCVLMVGHLLQYHPCVRKIQEIIASGELGQLQYVVSNRLNLGPFRLEENALWNFAPHDISVILSLCGNQMPNQVQCTGGAYITKGVADTTMTTMRFENDVRAHIYVSWLNPFKEQKLVVTGSSGMIVFDDTLPWEDKVQIYRDYVMWTNGRIPEVNNKEAERVDVPQKEPLREECRHFLECCKTRETPRTDGQEGMRVLKVLQAAEASMNEEGKTKNPHDKHSLFVENSGNYTAHSTAVVDAGAKIGDQTRIWHFSHVMPDATIGEKCNIGQNVLVSSGVTLGRNVKVQNNVSIYSGVTCEDDVFLGPSMVFTNIVNPRSDVSRKDQYVCTYVRKGSTIGANATVLCGIELGAHCFIGAGAVVTKDVKPYALIVGNPGKQVGWMSKHGDKLDLPMSTPEDQELTAKCPATGDAYSLVGDTLSYCGKQDSPVKESEMALV